MNLTDEQLQRIDLQIEAFSTTTNFDGSWRNFATYLCTAFNIEFPIGNAIKGIFSETVPHSIKKSIAVCILRVYNLNPKSITYNHTFYLSVFKLFDKALVEIYRICEIQKSDQNYLKESHLSDFITNTDKELANQLIIGSLDEIKTFEQKLKRVLTEKKYSDLFELFIPGLNVGAVYTKVFQVIDSYLKTPVKLKLEQYNSTLDEINKLIARASELKTKYSKIIVLEPFEVIKKYLYEDINSSPISKPAELVILSTGKKYPFRKQGEKFPISFEVINTGQGFAYDTKVCVKNHNDEITILNKEINIGKIDAEKTSRQIDCLVLSAEDVALITLTVEWRNYDNTIHFKEFDVEFSSQISNVDWDKLKLKQPYSLKPVESEDELVGRNEKLNELIAMCRNSDSCFITGQKRVGKTSLVKILKEKILKDSTFNTSPIYVSLQLEPILINTIDKLGYRICNTLKISDSRLSNLPIPEINHSLGNIYDFLIEAISLLGNRNILIIVDEFDLLPLELYRRGDIGDSLFLAFKNLSTEAKISFILVGGEKMGFIKNVQAIHLNLFRTFSLDYFDAENSWNDFEELVRQPVKGNLEIDSKAIQKIYSYTLGHPYFTKKICQELYTQCVNKHDTHVTVEEMHEAILRAIATSDVNDFAHFWDDGIMEKGDEQEEISVIRRRAFLALIEANGNNVANIPIHDYNLSQSSFEISINEFIVREIIQKSNGNIVFRVKFFYEWLLKYGNQKIFTTPADIDTIAERKRLEEIAIVKPEEISSLTKNWGPYQGKEVTTDRVREWLSQFGTNVSNQRLMFRILQNIIFFDNNLVRVSAQELYKSIVRKLAQSGLERVIGINQKKRDDILVSHLESNFAKSGAEYAKIFADENSIYAGSAVSKSKLLEHLSSNNQVRALVFIDDFAGSGDSVCRNLSEINSTVGSIIEEKNIYVFVGVICGFKDAKIRIQKFISTLNFKADVFFSKDLDEDDRCFGDYSKVFPYINERNKAKSICLEYGEKLYQNNPLGYKDCQALVVFPNACPNNTLPILWAETNFWNPLFKRI
jgi:hypothetical protein